MATLLDLSTVLPSIMINLIRQKRMLLLAISVIVLASVLRLYQLGNVPHGLTWDEAAIGYNGFAIWKTRRDEWLIKLPTSFRSFGDYKAPAAIYLNGGFTQLFGLNPEAVRLPFALGGILAVVGMMLLVKEWGRIYSWSKQESQVLSLVAGFMLATAPWHIHYSRIGFESGLSLTLLIWGIYFFLRGLARTKIRIFSLMMAFLLTVINAYMYHSAKIAVPLIFLAVGWQLRGPIVKQWRLLAGLTAGSIVALYPLINDSLLGKGLERAGTLIVAKTDSVSELLVIFTRQFFAHLSPAFLMMGETHNLRHGDGTWGVLFVPTFILLLIGLLSVVKNKFKADWLLAIAWIGAGIVPAALGSELVPHSNRSLLALPGFILLALIGLRTLSSWLKHSRLNQQIQGTHGETNMVWISVIGTLLLWQLLLLVSYSRDYYSIFARQSAGDFADGYLEAFAYVKKIEPEVEKIVFTSDYGQPYIFALFSRQTNPIWYQGGSLVKYEFKENINRGDLSRAKALIVGSATDDLPLEQAEKVIYGSDGQIRFKIFRTTIAK